MLVKKSNYIRKIVMESRERDLARIDLSGIPGDATAFEKAAEFCYGVNFEITVQNVAALRCAAEFLQMTDHYCEDNLAGRSDDFLSQVGLSSLSSTVKVLKSCEDLLPLAEELKIVDRCIDVASSKVEKQRLHCSSAFSFSWSKLLFTRLKDVILLWKKTHLTFVSGRVHMDPEKWANVFVYSKK